MKLKRLLAMLLTLCMVLTLLPGVAMASEEVVTTIYVAETGDDNNTGTEESPYANIQKAVNVANDGDTIIVKAGAYNVWCPTSDPNNYTGRNHNLFIGKNITIVGEGDVDIYSYQTVYQSTFDARITALISGSDGVVLDNLNLYPAYYPEAIDTVLPTVTDSRINSITGQSSLKVYYNQIVDTLTSYNNSKPTSETTITDVTVRNCTIGDPDLAVEEWGSAIYFNGYNNNSKVGISGGYTIENNILYGCISLCEDAGCDASSETCIIQNNTFYDNLMLSGERPTGWNFNSMSVFPTVTGNTFNTATWSLTDTDGITYDYCIGSRDKNADKIFTQEQLQDILDNNTFAGDLDDKGIGISIGAHTYSTPGDEHHAIIYAYTPVAQIGNSGETQTFGSLSEAIDEAKNGDTITLLQNIDLGTDNLIISKTLTLDLAGHVLESAYSGDYATITVGTAGDVTITDSTSGGGVNNTAGTALGNFGKLTIEGGTFIGDYPLYNWNNTTAAVVTISGGTFTAEGDFSIANCGSMTIENAITDGWIHNTAAMTITGGYFENFYAAMPDYTPAVQPSLTISGGTFHGEFEIEDETPHIPVAISGGMFESVLSDTLVATGYQYNSSTKCVFPANAAASIGDVAYTSLASAVNAAKYGETIDLLANNTEALTVSKVITIKLNGYTVGAVLAGEGFAKSTTDTQLEFSVSSEGATVVSVAVENEIGDGVSPEDTGKIAEVINLTQVNGVSDALGETGTESILAAADITPGDDDQVLVEISVSVTATESNLASGTLTFTAIPAANVYLNGVEHSSVPMSNDYLNGSEIQVLLPLPEGFEPKEIVHESSDGSSERFLESVAYPSAAKTFVIETINGYRFAKLIITKFSTFTMTSDEPVVTLLDITDAIAPINGGTPATVIAETDQYTGTVTWADASDVPVTQFTPSQTYTATITLAAMPGYTFEGVAADAFNVPCAMSATNDADTGVITATFISPPEDYITDGNGKMAYKYYYGNFDIHGTYNGQWMNVTCGDLGYGTKYMVNGGSPVDVYATGNPVDVGNGITLQIWPQFYGGGRFLRIVYSLHSSGSETQTVSFGSHADTEIGFDDSAPITEFTDRRGFKMVNDDSYNENFGAQFNFFGKETIGVTDVDTYWFGYWNTRQSNVFNQVGDDSYSGDSGMAYSWQDKTVAPGQTRTFSVLIGIGDAQSGENVPIGVNFDSQGGSDVDPITVEMAGDTISAPTPPTRNGYTFDGWYTEPECTNQFNFATHITATITLYAKWTQNTPPSGGGSYTPPKYPVTDTNQGEQAGGQIKLSKERAEAGDTVIITVTPDKGYENGNPVVLDTNKKPVEVTDNGNGTFSFKMPSGGVNVETKFSKIDYFDDVTENDWFDEASWYCAAHGLIQGTGHRQFDGHIGTNRAMLVTVLYRLANSTDDLESIFDDVESGKWYSEAIGWAAHNKIVEGYGNGKFGPDDTLTREQMVAVLYRYSMFMKYDVSKLNSLNTFTDADAISEWALQAMKWAAGNGIVEGIGNDLISPETGATRAQFAAMMQRFCANFVK